MKSDSRINSSYTLPLAMVFSDVRVQTLFGFGHINPQSIRLTVQDVMVHFR